MKHFSIITTFFIFLFFNSQVHGQRSGDIVVVDTEDALLVTTSENAQRVKGVVDALKLSGRGDVL